MRAFMQLLKGMSNMSFANQLWTCILTVANLVIPCFYVGQLEAQVVLAVFFVNLIAMTSLTALTGYTRLVSLGHALWLALIYYLWTRLADFPPDTFFGLWMRVLMIVNSIALLIDALNVYRYLRGDRQPLEKKGSN